MIATMPFDMETLRGAYADGLDPADVVREVFRRIADIDDPGIFILLRSLDNVLGDVAQLSERDPAKLPLWGIPFCVKDNIDIAGLETTAACPQFAYTAAEDAFAVARLRAAGGVLVGKTNLDQFATGLVGVRTPFPVPRNAIDPEIVPGGSSSGSAVAVAHGFLSFALGTDTAGSGRVPAALNNIVGLKPSLGALSARGVVPACRTLDTISVFALTVSDAYEVASIMGAPDTSDPYSKNIPFRPRGPMPPRLRIGVPDRAHRSSMPDTIQREMFEGAVRKLQSLDAEIVEIEMSPLFEIAHLLYAGSWVAERHSVIAELLSENPGAVHPTTKKVIEKAKQFSATDAFRHQYRLAELRLKLNPILSAIDMLAVPSIPRFVRVAETKDDPLGPNTELGTYTNFANLLDMCGIAVPTAQRADGRPGGITLLAGSGRDADVATVAAWLHASAGVQAGATGWSVSSVNSEPASSLGDDEMELAVVGAHMSGLPLNGEVTRLGGRFLRATKTAPNYRLYALSGGPPSRPGLVRADQGQQIALETWAIPKANFGEFILGVPSPLGIGTLRLETGETVKGFICETAGLDGAIDVTEYGGWRAYLASQ
jgi:allophanate hydrolase